MPYTRHVQRIATIFTDSQFAKIKKWAEENDVSLYALAKDAIKEYLAKRGVKIVDKDERHP